PPPKMNRRFPRCWHNLSTLSVSTIQERRFTMRTTLLSQLQGRCFMRPFTCFLMVAATLVMAAIPAFSDTETVKFDPARMWECPQADGSSIYTNKERAGCKLMALRELS